MDLQQLSGCGAALVSFGIKGILIQSQEKQASKWASEWDPSSYFITLIMPQSFIFFSIRAILVKKMQ